MPSASQRRGGNPAELRGARGELISGERLGEGTALKRPEASEQNRFIFRTDGGDSTTF
jgi:hypothetical protein